MRKIQIKCKQLITLFENTIVPSYALSSFTTTVFQSDDS